MRHADVDVVIPAGTADRLSEGKGVWLLPAHLVVHVGDTLRIENRDRAPEQVGPYWISAHQTLTQQFVAPGRMQGYCPIHPAGRLVIEIRA